MTTDKNSVYFASGEPLTLTIKQAQGYSGLSRSFLYKLFENGRLPRLKAGKRVLIMREDLDAYLSSIREENRIDLSK